MQTNEYESLVADFIAKGGEIKVIKTARKPRKNWFKAFRGRATKCARARRDNEQIRYSEYKNIDASFAIR